MIKFVNAIALSSLLSVSALAEPYAEFSTPVETASPEHTGYRNSFYLGASLGIGADFLHHEDSMTRYYSGDKATYDYSGFATTVDLKLGINIKQLLAIYSQTSFTISEGSLSGERYSTDEDLETDVSNIYIVTGAGATFYPFRREDMMLHGSYIGFAVQLGALASDFDDYNSGYYDDHLDDNWGIVGVSLELGKEWQVSDRFYLGAGLKLGYMGEVSHADCEDTDDYCDEYQHNVATIQAVVTVVRK